MRAPLGSHSQCKSTHFIEQRQALLEKLVKTKPCRHWKLKVGVRALTHWLPAGTSGWQEAPCACRSKRPRCAFLVSSSRPQPKELLIISSIRHKLSSLFEFAAFFPEPFSCLYFSCKLEDLPPPLPTFSPFPPWALPLKRI